MTTGEALEIVHGLAKAYMERTDYGDDEREALNIVEDLIVNHYGEDDEND